MRSDFRFRQVHLDFHTSEHIPGVGSEFDKDQFVRSLKLGNVNSVTVFARGHHGWCYYPTKIGKPHPTLKDPDLLGHMVEACRENDINVPIYHTVQWDERIAREHPEWRVLSADNGANSPRQEDTSALNQLTPTWHTICLNNPEYVDYLIALSHEVMDLYKPDGLFMDILLSWECVCPRCLGSMREKGLNPEIRADRKKNDYDVLMNYYRRVTDAVWERDPEMRIFHNSGHIHKGQRERYKYFSHLEIESLPTGGWGYDHFPVSARYANTMGLEYLGMTGKFHTSWGEFGGYKKPVALEYECALMVAMGARCSIGDQLHPSGRMDEATYRLMGPAYRRVEQIEQYAKDAVPISEIAVLSSEATSAGEPNDLPRRAERNNAGDNGAVRMLLELHHMFDVIDQTDDFSRYRLIILPDDVTLSAERAEKINTFLDTGGRIILSGTSGMDRDASRFLIRFNAEYSGAESEYSPDFVEGSSDLDPELVDAPFVVYERARKVRSAGTAKQLAGTRVPYFNRTWDHFCSHQHAPYESGTNSEYDAVIQDGNIIYFSHPIFRAYQKSGQPLLKYLVRGALHRLLSRPLVETTLPSSGRITVMEQPAEKRMLVHLLFAQTQLRGTGMRNLQGKEFNIEIIEDAVPLYEVQCRIRMESAPRNVYSGYSKEPFSVHHSDGYLTVTVPKLYLHEIIVIER
jgi:hypothetical protein